MKKNTIGLCLLTICVLCPVFSYAQKRFFNGRMIPFEDLRRKSVIKLSPFHFFDRSIQLNSEFFKENYKTSFVAGFTGTYRDDKEVSDQGFALELQARHYPRSFRVDTSRWVENGAYGVYFGVGVSAGANVYKSKSDYYSSSYTMASGSTTANSHWVTPSVFIGYQLIVWDAMFLDFYIGGGMKMNDVKKSSSLPGINPELEMTNGSIFSRYYKGILPKLGFTLGVGI